ncbi:MAG: glutaredoxin 3 [Andreesenia angusta]|nr:glutaredoxin 3 [Andreesenia angusta]
MKKKIVIYTKNYCPYCKRAVAFLERNNLEFENVDVTNDEELLKPVSKKTGVTTVPQVFVDDEFIGGYDDMVALKKAGEINEKFGIEE